MQFYLETSEYYLPIKAFRYEMTSLFKDHNTTPQPYPHILGYNTIGMFIVPRDVLNVLEKDVVVYCFDLGKLVYTLSIPEVNLAHNNPSKNESAFDFHFCTNILDYTK